MRLDFSNPTLRVRREGAPAPDRNLETARPRAVIYEIADSAL